MLTKKSIGDILNIVATKRGRLFDSKREGKKTKDTEGSGDGSRQAKRSQELTHVGTIEVPTRDLSEGAGNSIGWSG